MGCLLFKGEEVVSFKTLLFKMLPKIMSSCNYNILYNLEIIKIAMKEKTESAIFLTHQGNSNSGHTNPTHLSRKTTSAFIKKLPFILTIIILLTVSD